MKSTLVCLVVASIAHLSDAFPSLAGSELEPRALKRGVWNGVPAGGVRSPCPGTNTLANHGYISRTGKGITKAGYAQGFLDAFGMDKSVTKGGINTAFETCAVMFNSGNPCTSINLDMLDSPHRQEHDASLTRDDFKTLWASPGDNHSFNQSVWSRSLASVAALGPITHLNVQTANTMRLRRVEQAKIDDPQFNEKFLGSVTEHAFYLTTMNDPVLGEDRLANPQARLDWVNHWFQNEELPTALGWVRPAIPITNLPVLKSIIVAQSTVPAVGGSITAAATATATATASGGPTGSPTATASLT